MMTCKIKELAAIVRPFQRSLIAILIITALTAGTVFAGVSVSYDVTIYDGDQEALTIETLKSDPYKIIEQAGIVLGEADSLDLSAFSGGKNSKITILRAFTVTVRYGNEDSIEVTVPGSVADALEKAGIVLNNDDKVTPSPDTALTDGLEILVANVEYKTRTETEVVKYTSTTEKTASLYVGQSKIKTKGVNGKKDVVYKDQYVNGELVESTIENETVIVEPINEVKLVGTAQKPKPIKLKANSAISTLAIPASIEFDENGLPINYKRIIEGRAAAYTGGGTTASGKKAQVGYVAVNPKEIPYGTKLYVVSMDGKYVYGYCEAADTGGFIYNGYYTVDLYMNTLSECYQWGDRAVRIYVLG